MSGSRSQRARTELSLLKSCCPLRRNNGRSEPGDHPRRPAAARRSVAPRSGPSTYWRTGPDGRAHAAGRGCGAAQAALSPPFRFPERSLLFMSLWCFGFGPAEGRHRARRGRRRLHWQRGLSPPICITARHGRNRKWQMADGEWHLCRWPMDLGGRRRLWGKAMRQTPPESTGPVVAHGQ